jgi:colanic acid biosynthesis glycosyl transferase WcaI
LPFLYFIALVLNIIGRIFRPFMIFGYLNSPTHSFRKLTRVSCRIPDDCIDSKRYPLFMAREVISRPLSNVTFLPPVPVDEVGAYLQAADVLLVHLADDPVFDITIPQKTQAYLLAGKPILMAVRGEAADLVAGAGAGIVVPPENAVALAAAVRLLAQKSPAELSVMGQRGAQFYRQNMSMDQGVREVESLLMQAVPK